MYVAGVICSAKTLCEFCNWLVNLTTMFRILQMAVLNFVALNDHVGSGKHQTPTRKVSSIHCLPTDAFVANWCVEPSVRSEYNCL